MSVRFDTTNNHTRWSSADLEEFIRELGEVEVYCPADPNNRYAHPRTYHGHPGKELHLRNIRLLTGGGSDDLVKVGENTLHLRSPRWLADSGLQPLETLAASVADVAPKFFLQEIGVALFREALGVKGRSGRYYFQSNDHQTMVYAAIAKRVNDAIEAVPVRVLGRIEAGPEARRVRTTEEKIERLRSDSFYGSGGVLEGPRWGYSVGHRAATGQWAGRISSARDYYDTELGARENHAATIRKLGGEVVPYETFPQYLRRVADEMEKAETEGRTWRRR